MAPENLHHRLLDNLTTAILLIEPDLSVQYLNTAAETLLEVSGQRVRGEPITLLLSEKDGHIDSLIEAIHHAHPYTKREAQLNLPNGNQITVDYAVTPITELDGKPSLLIELSPLDRLLRISREEGMISSQQNTQALVRGIAHEVKNPLGGIRGAAQLLARELKDPALEDYTNVIIEEADRLRNLVDTMLGPRKAPENKPTNIHEILEYVRHIVEAESHGEVHILRDYDPSIPDLCGDREQLIQAVLNIVRNAAQALKRGNTQAPTITLRTRTSRQFTIGSKRHRLVCRIEIIDNGPGIPEDLHQAIFLPMISGRPEGSGLGLAISQSIVHRHDGLIESSSEPGCTVFALNIPLENTL